MRHEFLRRVLLLAFLLVLAGPGRPAHAQPFAYVSNAGSDDVSVIDVPSRSVVASIPVGLDPCGLALTPDGTRLYVANVDASGLSGIGRVSVIDTAAHRVARSIILPDRHLPRSVTLTPDATRLYVLTRSFPQAVFIYEVGTDTLLGSFNVGFGSPNVCREMAALAFTPGGSSLYVSCQGNDRRGPGNQLALVRTDTHAVVDLIPVQVPESIAVLAGGGKAYVTSRGNVVSNGAISVLDTNLQRFTHRIEATFGPSEAFGPVVPTPDGTTVYVPLRDSELIAVIDVLEDRFLNFIRVGRFPGGVAFTPDGSEAYVAIGAQGANSVDVIDTQRNLVVDRVPVGEFPCGVAMGPPRILGVEIHLVPPLVNLSPSAAPLTAIVSLPPEARVEPERLMLVAVDGQMLGPIEGERVHFGGKRSTINSRLHFSFSDEVAGLITELGEGLHVLSFASEILTHEGSAQFRGEGRLEVRRADYRE